MDLGSGHEKYEEVSGLQGLTSLARTRSALFMFLDHIYIYRYIHAYVFIQAGLQGQEVWLRAPMVGAITT